MPKIPVVSRRGLTMVELMIAVLIGSIIVYAGSRLLMSGLRSFSKSTATLSLTQAVGIFLENLETDIKRSRRIQCDNGQLHLTTIAWNGEKVLEQKVEYTVPSIRLGIERAIDDGEAHPFCRDLKIKRLDFSKPLGEQGVLVGLEISVPPLDKESISFKRFYFAEAHPANALADGFQRE